MRIPTAIGQYVPVESPVHSLEPRVKMALAAALAAALFLVDGFAGMVVIGLAEAIVVALSRVPARAALRGLRAVALLLSFTIAAHALVWRPAVEPLLRLGPLGVDGPGLARGLFFVVRIVLLVAGTTLLTLTTTPVELADALERLLRPLSRLGVPAHEIAMMLTIALRFIPTTAEEAEKIVTAQQARGARFDVGGPIRRARAYVPVLVPLFVNLFRRADDLAIAMEARAYRGGEGRTRLRESVMLTRDWTVLLAGVAASAAVAWLF